MTDGTLPAARLRALHDAALAIGHAVGDDPEVVTRLVATVVRLAVEALGASGGAIALAEDPAWSGLAPGTSAEGGFVMLRDNGVAERRRHRSGGTAMRALEGQAAHVVDTQDAAHGGAYDWLVASGVRSFAVVPLRSAGGGPVLGALIVNFPTPGELSAEDREVLDLFAAHAAVALDRAKRLHAERRRASQAAQMAQVLSHVAAAETVEAVLEQLLRGAVALLGGTAGTARLAEGELGERLVSLGIEPESGEEGVGSALDVPINAVGRHIGSLRVTHPQPDLFTPSDVALAAALGALAGEAVERARLAAERAERNRLDAALLVARTVAHEINNALAPITGYAELLSMSPKISSDDGLTAYARRILWASTDVAGKVKKLQRIIRLEEVASPMGPEQPLLDLERSTAEE